MQWNKAPVTSSLSLGRRRRPAIDFCSSAVRRLPAWHVRPSVKMWPGKPWKGQGQCCVIHWRLCLVSASYKRKTMYFWGEKGLDFTLKHVNVFASWLYFLWWQKVFQQSKTSTANVRFWCRPLQFSVVECLNIFAVCALVASLCHFQTDCRAAFKKHDAMMNEGAASTERSGKKVEPDSPFTWPQCKIWMKRRISQSNSYKSTFSCSYFAT